MPTSRPAKLIHRLAPAFRMVLAAAALAALTSVLQAQRVMLATRGPSQTANGLDAGELPSSTPIEITLTLAMSPEQSAALDELLASLTTASSPSYHQWLTPQQFAARFGATGDQIATLSAWLTSQSLSVDTVSASKTRLTVSGTVDEIESAFAVTLHQYRIGDSVYYANTTAASLPAQIAPSIASVSGLDTVPPVAAIAGITRTSAPPANTADPLSALATAIDANATPILAITTPACTTNFAQADYDAYRALFRQANAQGITVLTTSGCTTNGASSFPASLTEATAVATPNPTHAANSTGITPRPAWQNAPGLPLNPTRAEPDLATPSFTAFAQTLATIIQQSGTRQGNINATLYALATEPGLYTQPDAAAPGTWEPATGLGQVDLAKLAQAFPRGTNASTTSVSSSIYGATYGQPFTLAATVQPSGGGAVPTGTITFTAAAQGTLGTATLINGNATLPLAGTLPVGTYTTSASYSGDTTYAPSSSPPSAVVTISQATGTINASISPSTIGAHASATLTTSVTLPYPGEPPTGNIIATVNGVPGAVYTTPLTPVPNTASAAATISIPAPANPGTYAVQITCAGSANFQCPTPGLVSLTSTGSGATTNNTTTAVAISPLAPTAGQPATLTATITTIVAGTPTGNVTFFVNGNSVATAPVSNKQAAAVAALQAGAMQILTAAYSGDATFNASTSPGLLVNVTGVASAMSLTASATSALSGANIFFTAQVTAGVPPTGIVTFYDTYNGNTSQIGAATLAPNRSTSSTAQITTSGLLDGAHTISAAYPGDANSAASTSNVAIAIYDYTITPSPQTLTLTTGQTGTVTLAMGVIGSFSGNVTFTCSAPAGTQTSCSISPTSRTGAGNVILTITTTATQARTTQPAGRLTRAASGAALAMLLCFCAPRRRRRLSTFLVAILTLGIVAATGAGLGCGASTSPTPAAEPGSPAGATLFSIYTAGSDGITTVTHNFQYQVTLK